MYGTVMIGKIKPGASIDKAMRATEEWNQTRHVPGFRRTDVLVGDDGSTMVMTAQFDTKADYQRLGGDPEQDAWWREVMVPILDGEPTWIDGTFSSTVR